MDCIIHQGETTSHDAGNLTKLICEKQTSHACPTDLTHTSLKHVQQHVKLYRGFNHEIIISLLITDCNYKKSAMPRPPDTVIWS